MVLGLMLKEEVRLSSRFASSVRWWYGTSVFTYVMNPREQQHESVFQEPETRHSNFPHIFKLFWLNCETDWNHLNNMPQITEHCYPNEVSLPLPSKIRWTKTKFWKKTMSARWKSVLYSYSANMLPACFLIHSRSTVENTYKQTHMIWVHPCGKYIIFRGNRDPNFSKTHDF